MKIVGTYQKRVVNEEGYAEITFLVKNFRNKELIKELEKDKDYRIELNIVKSKRSIEQNNLMWKLIHDISIAVNGTLANDSDDWDIYLQALERAGAKFEYYACLPEGEHLLRNSCRAIKLMNKFEYNGNTFNSYKVYAGSSKMNTKEMTLLINTVMDMAAECGVDTTYYDGGLL